ncbi:Spy/CpxP family protein refolding chaperone [Polaromonas sp.]|uniref:Spy/CpxP family protein refolding chaperone n=1 Tax=Polaromonas sp. TaxID=1869339 RepID=UPI002FC8407E
MAFARKPLQSFILTSLLATAGAAAIAQGTAATQPAPATPAATAQPARPHGERMRRHDPAKMQAWMAKRQAELKAKLQLTPTQEGAWASYAAAMQEPLRTGARPDAAARAEFDKLSTPQRIDRMRTLRTQRMAEMNAAMDKRGEATKSFYATLSPEQQKVFDAESTRRRGHGGQHGRHHQPG